MEERFPRRIGAGFLALACVAALLGPAQSNASPDQAATDTLVSQLRVTLGPTDELFGNCPLENTFPWEGATAHACEFRAVTAGVVQTGSAVAVPDGGGWRIDEIFLGRTSPDRWRTCARSSIGGAKLGVTGTKFVRAHGIPCGFLGLLAGDARGNTSRKKLRIRRKFIAGGRGTNTVGWVINIYTCKGRNLARHGGRRPSRTFQADCFNMFGDGFSYRFELQAPKPPRPKRKHGGGDGGGGSKCAAGYSPCLPVVGDLDCDDIPESKKPVHVTGSDQYRLDRDGDGLGCE